DCADEVIAVAMRLGGALGTDLALLYVVDAPAGSPGLIRAALHQDAREHLDPLVSRLSAAGITSHTHVIAGAPAAAILSVAERENVDMIVMGTHGRRGLRRLWAGSVAEEVLRKSPCPVTIVRTTDPGDTGPTEAQLAAEAETSG
ncbi:MAG: nucleotide-binding universal stress UspA family protein, partial [Myxococcota bacterium]